jgi:putative DNA primase/helicase
MDENSVATDLKLIRGKNRYTCQNIVNDLSSGIEIDFKENVRLPWVESYYSKSEETMKYRLVCPVLKQFILLKHKFLFVLNKNCGGFKKYIYKDGYYSFIDNEEMLRIVYQYIPTILEDSKKIEETMKLVYLAVGISSDSSIDLENLINFKNGVLDFNTMEFHNHSHKFLLTSQRDCNWNPSFIPETNHFDNYLNHLCYGKEDRKEFFLQCMGLIISNIDCSRLKKSVMMFGNHDTGKSKIRELLKHIVGERNCSAQDMHSLETDPFAISNIFNKRMIGSGDMSFMSLKEVKVFKNATGGDTLTARVKFKDNFDFVFKGFILTCCNELPKFGGDKGDGVYNRIITIECSNKITKVNKTLLEDMLAEKDYIVAKAINAAKRVIENGYDLSIPNDCHTANEQYKISNDSVLSFARDCVIKFDIMNLNKKYRYTTKQLYDIYTMYCKDNHKGHCETRQKFKSTLESNFDSITKKIMGNFYYYNITLNEQCILEYTNDDVPDELKNIYNMLDDSSYEADEDAGKQLSDATYFKAIEIIKQLSLADKLRIRKDIDLIICPVEQVKMKDDNASTTLSSL